VLIYTCSFEFPVPIEEREGLFFFIIIYSSKSIKNNTEKSTPIEIRGDKRR
jgi:hypothetical protein